MTIDSQSHSTSIFQTIWDGNGVDTYDLQNYTNGVSVDLRPGASCYFSPDQLVKLGGTNNSGWAQGNVYNAIAWDTRSLIENATCGGGDDYIIGNDVGNFLQGGAGSDYLDGGLGNDGLVGGESQDGLTGGARDDRFLFNTLGESSAFAPDAIWDFEGAVVTGGDFIDLSNIDADFTTSANESFTLGLTGKGGLWAVDLDNGYTEIRANVTDNNSYQFALDLDDGAVSASDYTINEFVL